MGITGVPFGRTEVLVPPLELEERDLARGGVPGSLEAGDLEKVETCVIVVDILPFLKT